MNVEVHISLLDIDFLFFDYTGYITLYHIILYHRTLHSIIIIVLPESCVSYRLEVCGSSLWSKSVGTVFPTAVAHFLSLCHILVFLTLFQTLHQQKDYYSPKAQLMVSIF